MNLHREQPAHVSRWLAIAAALAITAVAVLLILIATHWPFTRARVLQSLEQAWGGKVRMGQFHEIFFPYPGCVADDVEVLQYGGNHSPIIAAAVVTVEDSWPNLLALRYRIDQVRVEKLHISIPAEHENVIPPQSPDQRDIIVGELIADNALLDIGRSKEDGPLRFELPNLRLHEVGRHTAFRYDAVIHNPEPPGLITSSGTFGPWRHGDGGLTPVSGKYRFEHADLAFFKGIAGTLSSEGKFNGPLGQIEVSDDANVADFEVVSSGHKVALKTQFKAIVNGLNGDTSLTEVNAHFLRSPTVWHGGITDKPGQSGKTASLDLAGSRDRVQDLLWLFVKSPQSPLEGGIVFRGQVELPPGKERFLKKLRLQGDFNITDARFTNPVTQTKVGELSGRATGMHKKTEEFPTDIPCEIKGVASLRDGVASLSLLTFTVPGAEARLTGKFNLITQAIDLHGTLSTDASLSHDAGGIKAVFLKPLDPLFKKKQAGAVVPVFMGGTYAHATYGMAIVPKK